MEEKLKEHIARALHELGLADVPVMLERPADLGHGDYSTNVAMAGAKKAAQNPRALAEAIVAKLNILNDPDILLLEIAGPGFINIKLSKHYFSRELASALVKGEHYGASDSLEGRKVIVEYTDPNPFKEFHIGHLLPNIVGESISRLMQFAGGDVRRVNYQGDVGMHVARAIWGMQREDLPDDDASVEEKVAYLGRAYARGATTAKFDDIAKHEIGELNKKIYERRDESINRLYDLGKAWSLAYFETIYQTLGTKFDHYFFESETAGFGKEMVEKNIGTIFEKSDGAIVYKGDETMGLHTRVFINTEGLPTYEAKELGLAKLKYDYFPYDHSVVVTSNEIVDYFKVLLSAMSEVYRPEGFAEKTKHIAHGTLRLKSGKMSSRTGDVITALSLINEAKEVISTKVADDRGLTQEERDSVVASAAVGAIKYSILRQQVGHDMVFDFAQSLSFEGDSGPYLQYTYARTRSLLQKGDGKVPDADTMAGDEVRPLHKLVLRFPEVVARAQEGYAPHYIANYLVELAREFNAFYANTVVLDGASEEPYKLALVSMVSHILERGLWLLGIAAPAKM